jgi:hypothetical protein
MRAGDLDNVRYTRGMLEAALMSETWTLTLR